MFFLRCAFWLSIVYSSMSWTNGGLQVHGGRQVHGGDATIGASAAATKRDLTTRLAKTAVAGATDLCAHHAAECLADAARLTSLIASTDQADQGEPGPAAADVASRVDAGPIDDADTVPLPVPDPRRRAGDAKLAPAS